MFSLKCEHLICLKGLCESFTSLFDHRGVLQNEANHFVKEIEERIGPSADSKLNNIIKTLKELENSVPDVKELLRAKLGELNAAVIDASNMCQAIKSDEEQVEGISTDLQMREVELRNERMKLDDHLNNKAIELDQQLHEELEQLKRQHFNKENFIKTAM